MMGIFITFEGPDGAGKSTQIGLLRDYLEKKGIHALITREPGGTPIGEKIRSIILDKENSEMDPVTEAYLYAAARAQHVRQVIAPGLAEGKVVISDRFLDSSIAYQAFGRGLGDTVAEINRFAVDGVRPDLTFLITVDEITGSQRVDAGGDRDRIESEGDDFRARVLRGFLTAAQAEPDRFRLIDGSLSIEEVSRSIIAEVEKML